MLYLTYNVRVISGIYGGRCIIAPPTSLTRPTTDRVRESLFSILDNRIDFTNTKVLDIFAGSGSLGIESLSRGAMFCHFNDQAISSVNVVKQNLTELKVPKTQYHITKGDVNKQSFYSVLSSESPNAHKTTTEKNASEDGYFNLLLLDPPYNFTDDAIEKIIISLNNANILAKDALIVIESANERNLATLTEHHGFRQVLARKYGSTYLQILLKTP